MNAIKHADPLLQVAMYFLLLISTFFADALLNRNAGEPVESDIEE